MIPRQKELIDQIAHEIDTKDNSKANIYDQIEELDKIEVGDKMYLHSIAWSLVENDPEYPMDDDAKKRNAGEDLRLYEISVEEGLIDK